MYAVNCLPVLGAINILFAVKVEFEKLHREKVNERNKAVSEDLYCIIN